MLQDRLFAVVIQPAASAEPPECAPGTLGSEYVRVLVPSATEPAVYAVTL